MPVIDVSVTNKIAKADPEAVYVCGNSDFVINFTFDEEWNAYKTKTARFVCNGAFTDVVFDGTQCDVPVLSNACVIAVGVYTGDIHTTTPAYIKARKSILCGSGPPDEPFPDAYAQIMEKLNMISDDIGAAVMEYLEEHPIDFETNETLTFSNGVLSVNTAEDVAQDNTLPITSAAVYTEVGNINALLGTI